MNERTKTYIIDIAGAVISAVLILLVFSFIESSWAWLTSQEDVAKFKRYFSVIIWVALNAVNALRRFT